MCSANRGRQSCQPACGSLVGMQRNILLCSRSLCVGSGKSAVKYPPLFTELVCRKLEGSSEMSSSVHGALAELIGEVSRRDGGVREYLFNQSEPPRHVVPLPLYAPQTGGDNLASRCVVGDTVSTPSSRCATPPMCSANRGRHLASRRVVASWGCKEISSSVHGALAELIGEVSRRDGGVGDTASTPSSLRATPPICSANRGRQSWGQIYGINPLVTLCHSPYMLRKQGETILPAVLL